MGTETIGAMFDEDAEVAILGCLLTPSANGARDSGDLRVEDFYLPKHGLIFRACQELTAAHIAVDTLCVSNRLQESGKLEDAGGRAFVHSLVGASYSPPNLPHYAAIVRSHARRREEVRIGRLLVGGELNAGAAEKALRELETTAENTGAASAYIDWPTFWDRDHDQADWVFEDVLARGRGHALYASHKEGKSLLMLYIAAKLATGSEPTVVVYLDYEMGADDLFERLEDMGYGPGTDFSRLRYALLPTLPPLDTSAGARALTDLVDHVQGEWPEHHLVVIIDTIGRAVSGEENSSDTFRDFYAHTGIELKRRGITWARLDHGGKDLTRGQRGSSGKGDDVDIVWKLVRTENGVCLHRDLSRARWVPEKVAFGMTEEPLAYRRLAGDWPAGTNYTAELLDRLQVPTDACARVAQTALRDANEGRRKQVVVAALRWRRERAEMAQ